MDGAVLKTLEPQFEASAKALVSWPTMVRIREPISRHAWGECSRAKEGFFVIDINPDCPDPLHVFLHECAHLIFDNQDILPTDDHKGAPLSEEPAYNVSQIRRKTNRTRADAINLEREAKAEAWADRMCAWVETKASAYRQETEFIYLLARLYYLELYKQLEW